MFQTYNILHGLHDIDSSFFFDDKDSNRRGHQLSVKNKSCSTTLRRNFFTIRVLNIWNSLPANIGEVDTVNAFKNGLDRLCRSRKNMFVVNFDFQDSYTLRRLLNS